MLPSLIANFIRYLFTMGSRDKEELLEEAERYANCDAGVIRRRRLFRKLRYIASRAVLILIAVIFACTVVVMEVDTDMTLVVWSLCAVLICVSIVVAIIAGCMMSITKKQLENELKDQNTKLSRSKTAALWQYLEERGDEPVRLRIAEVEEIIGTKLDNVVLDEIMHTTNRTYLLGRANLELGFLEFAKK